MDQAALIPFSNWQNFYVIVGSAAGALTGLQFVVLTLIAQARAAGSMSEIRAFGTPTVVHFCTALFISALMCAPWQSRLAFCICLSSYGLLGVLYSLSIFWHAHKATYNPDFGDWIWYTALPVIAHSALITAAVLYWWNSNWALPLVAVDVLLFLIVGIHNSWDTITYIVIKQSTKSSE